MTELISEKTETLCVNKDKKYVRIGSSSQSNRIQETAKWQKNWHFWNKLDCLVIISILECVTNAHWLVIVKLQKKLCKFYRIGSWSHLTSNFSLWQSKEIGVRPFAFWPRFNKLQVLREVDGLQLVVHELPDVPRQIVVSENEKEKSAHVSIL